MPAVVPTPVSDAALTVAERVAATAFGGVSLLRRGRSLHPNGIAFHAIFEIESEPPGFATARLLRRPQARPAIVRLSRSVGLPEGLPDIYGAAVRIPDAYGAGRHQDLLVVTGGENALARHLFTPARGYAGRTMSSVLPYRIGGRSWVFLMRAEDDARHGRLHTLESVARAARERTLTFEISLAPTLGGRPVRIGRLRVERLLAARAEHGLRFNPVNTGDGIELTSWLNRVRPDSYRASQAARGREVPRGSEPERRAELAAESADGE